MSKLTINKYFFNISIHKLQDKKVALNILLKSQVLNTDGHKKKME